MADQIVFNLIKDARTHFENSFCSVALLRTDEINMKIRRGKNVAE